jgi:hypothetical protein
MNIHTKYILLCTGFLASLATSAQNIYSGYFTDNYTYRYQMNPAFSNDKNFVSIPVIGNLNVGLNGNLNLSDVIYKLDGKTVLFTNPGISSQEVINNISKSNEICTNEKIGILSAGFKGFGGYNTISINAIANISASIPGSLFSLAKEGISNKSYDISQLRASANAYAEIGLGHSRDFNSLLQGLRMGATLKFLVGGGNVDAYLNNANLTLNENSWAATTNADIYASIGGLRYDKKTNKNTGKNYVSGANLDDGYSISGYGIGLDFGALYEIGDWTFSAAILDLGFISYKNTQWASTNGTQTVDTDAYIFNVDDNADNSFDNELDRLRDNLYDLYQLSDNGTSGNRTKSLATTLNFAADYKLPAYKNLHFGLLNTTRINGMFTTTNFRLSANLSPAKAFSCGANVNMGTYGLSLGWILSLNVTGFNLFAGMDNVPTKLAKQGIPLNSNASLNFGINIPF